MDLHIVQKLEGGMIGGSNFNWSPNGIYFSVSVKHRILIQEAKTLALKVTYSIGNGVSTIDSLQWSADSLFIAAISLPQGYVFIRKIDEPHWKSKITLGSKDMGSGLLEFQWAPDARHLLTTSNYYTQLTIWSLNKSAVTTCRNICPIPKYKSFTSNGEYLAVAQFDEHFKTGISIYESLKWTLKVKFAVKTKDLSGIKFSPNDSVIVLWDSPLFSNLYVYSHTGELLKHYSPDGISLGIESIGWSSSGKLLALTNHRNILRVLNGLSFGVLLEEELDFSLSKHFIHKNCLVYCETFKETRDGLVHPIYEIDKSWSTHMMNESNESNESENYLNDNDAEDIKFSQNEKYFACRLKKSSNTIWIWDAEKFVINSCLIQRRPITDFQWDPNGERLICCTGGSHMYFWTPTKSYIKHIEPSFSSNMTYFKAQKIDWNTQGISFAVQDLSLNKIILGFMNYKEK